MTRRRQPAGRRWPVVVTAVGLTLVLGACGGGDDLPQDALDPQGPYARQVHNLAKPVFIIAGVVFVLVQALVIYSAVKFRRRSEDEAPVQVHGNIRMELTWTIIPAAVLAVVGVLTVGNIVDLDRVPKGDVLNVTVIGHQWWWEYDYTDHDVTTANELHIPTGRPVAVKLESVDVIHSFWPPKLAGKLDAIPNRTNHLTLQADEPGTYYGQCAEFCGISHADMRLRVVAHEPAEFEEWLESNAEEAARPDEKTQPEAAAGAALFRAKGCASCHTVKGFSAGELGPDLTHLQQRKVFAGAIFDLNPANLRAWLRDPPAEKPGALMPNLDLTEEEITDLIAYLETLK
ncbi:MAG TPA: cytochrome c oxidase subunit II [Acidimicrobiales bacterium]|nr:cytochrome c oxidase subunit II [Acidimicrobiales bacterium]